MTKQELGDDEKKIVAAMADALAQFEALRPNMPIIHLRMLLMLALEEGKSQKYYSGKWHYPTSTVSRAMLDMGRRMRKGEAGLGLVEEQVSFHSLREHEVSLSVKGRTLLHKIIRRFK